MTHTFARFRVFIISIAIGAAILGFAAPRLFTLHAAKFKQGKSHKIYVRDRNLTAEITARGGRLVADYEAYQVIDIDDALARSLQKHDGVDWRDDDNLVLLNSGVIHTDQSEKRAQNGAQEQVGAPDTNARTTGGKGMHMVQFVGPIKPEWVDELLATGVEIVNYVPNNAYLVYGNDGAMNKLQAWISQSQFVQWNSAYQSGFKLSPSARTRMAANATSDATSNESLFAIQLFNDAEANEETLALMESLAMAPIKTRSRTAKFINLVGAFSPEAIDRIAARIDVVSIMGYGAPRRFDERQCQIVAGNLSGSSPSPGDYLSFLASQGFTQQQFQASGFAVNISDSGVDAGTNLPTHFGLYTGGNRSAASRLIYSRLVGIPSGSTSTIQGCDGHGTINAHIIAGYVPSGSPYNAFPHVDASGFRYGMGIAPFVKVGSSVIFDGSGSPFGDFTYPSYQDLESMAYQDGSRISSNSWGSTAGGEYNFEAQAYDILVRDSQPEGAINEKPGNQQNVIVFAAGNEGPITQTIGAPGTAKNVITVGASENVRLFGGADKCTTADVEADSANDMSIFSSRGPTEDGRMKPDIVAPGTHITGGVFQVANPPANGQADPCFTGSSTCGGPPSSQKFFPAGQQFYTASTGTSHSTPAVAGAAALIRQRFINEGLIPPGPAMTKAVLMNSARYLNGSDANDSLWSKSQGMGAVNLRSAFGLFATPTLLRDEEAVDLFTASGQTRTFNGTISDPSKPFRVTLAWTDAPGSTVSPAYVNNLDLEVTIGGQVYRGNVFNGAFSVSGGTFDSKNNVESVFIPAGVSGAFTIRVIATNIAGDGVPNNATPLDQDFALVVFNMTEGVKPVIDAVSGAIVSESCSPGNNAIDPGELVTVSLSLQNSGRATPNNLIATLLATGGVNSPSGAQSYGALVPRSGSVSKQFSFRAGGVCGGTLTATLRLQDGSTDLGTVSFNFKLGATKTEVNSFANTSTIFIPTSGAASLYPSTINVAGIPGEIARVTVTLNNVNHTNPDDLDILLVAPGGQKILLMSDCGGGGDLVNTTLTFDDTAPLLPNTMAIVPGTFGPANYGIADTFPSPAPAGPYNDPQRLSTFNGISPNGDWKLFVYDDLASNSGNIAGGWSLTITTNAPACCASSACSMTIAPQTIPAASLGSSYSQSFTQSGGAAPVTFTLNGALPTGISFANGLLSGAPTQSGDYPFMVTATDALHCSASATYTLSVAANTCIANVSPTNWKGEYFNNRSLSGSPVMVRDDGAGSLDFDFGTGSPSSSCGVGVDNFSARWTRTVNFSAGTYRFTATGDDGIRLYVDGQLKIDQWIDQAPTTYTADVALSAGNHDLRFEFYENAVGAVARLSWTQISTPAPAPVVSSVSPSSPTTSASNQNVIVNGSNFQQGLTVGIFFPGNSGSTPDATLSGSQILNVTATSFTMQITLGNAGTWGIRVNNPDGQQSARLNFSVVNGSACVATVPTTNWRGEYFNNRALSGSPVMVRDDGAGFLNFDFGTGSPSSSCGVGVDNFSARWTRTVNFSAGTYRFTATGDDGIRLYVDGQLKIDQWIDQAPTTYTADVALSAGNHDLKFEFYENAVGALARLSWTQISTPAPAPVVSSVSPSSPTTSASNQNVVVNGSNFQQGLTVGVFFPGNSGSTPDATLSGSQILNVTATSFTMQITLGNAGTWGIRVNNPDGQQSARLNFSVVNGSACVATVPTTNWRGEYFNNRALSGSPVMVRDDGAGFLDFDFGLGSPSSSCGVGVDNFSTRWTRTVNFSAGTYRFTATGDDGIRLYVDGQLKIDQWIDQAPTTYTADVALSAGNHDLRFEFYENGVGAVARLSWTQISTPAPGPANYEGYVDTANCNVIAGWAANRNQLNTPITVSVYDGSTLIATALANQLRADVGSYLGDNGLHGFSIPTPSSLKNGAAHNISVRFEASSSALGNTPRSLTCAASLQFTGDSESMEARINLAPGNSAQDTDLAAKSSPHPDNVDWDNLFLLVRRFIAGYRASWTFRAIYI